MGRFTGRVTENDRQLFRIIVVSNGGMEDYVLSDYGFVWNDLENAKCGEPRIDRKIEEIQDYITKELLIEELLDAKRHWIGLSINQYRLSVFEYALDSELYDNLIIFSKLEDDGIGMTLNDLDVIDGNVVIELGMENFHDQSKNTQLKLCISDPSVQHSTVDMIMSFLYFD